MDERFALLLVGLSAHRQKELPRWARRRRIDLSGVSMLQWVSLDEFHNCYQEAGQFWFTSYRDTSGTVAMWALAYGVPAIGFDHQGGRVMLGDGRGELVNRGSISECLDAWVDKALLVASRGEGQREPAARPFLSAHLEWCHKPKLVLEANKGGFALRVERG